MTDFGQLEDVNREIKEFQYKKRVIENKIEKLKVEKNEIQKRLLETCMHDWEFQTRSYGCDPLEFYCKKCQNYK